jgi:ketosteroid isomerase-like protein
MDDLLPGLSEALEAMNRGDVGPAVALLDPDVDWRGRSQGHLWWKHTPSCHGPDEARENLERQAAKRWTIDQVEQIGDRVVVGGGWTTEEGAPGTGSFFQVLTVDGGKIVDIHGCNSRREAMKYARQRTS